MWCQDCVLVIGSAGVLDGALIPWLHLAITTEQAPNESWLCRLGSKWITTVHTLAPNDVIFARWQLPYWDVLAVLFYCGRNWRCIIHLFITVYGNNMTQLHYCTLNALGIYCRISMIKKPQMTCNAIRSTDSSFYLFEVSLKQMSCILQRHTSYIWSLIVVTAK